MHAPALAALATVLVLCCHTCGAISAYERTGTCGPQKEHLDAIVAKFKDSPVPILMTCAWEVTASTTVPPQCCCFFSHEAAIKKCLPHAIIVGAQKAGTTALFGHMLLRPDFERPKRKEVQYFGKREMPSLLWYLRHMPPHFPTKVRGFEMVWGWGLFVAATEARRGNDRSIVVKHEAAAHSPLCR